MKITMTFTPDGASVTNVTGITGKSCKNLTKFLEDELMKNKAEIKLKAEFYQSGHSVQNMQKKSL